MTGGCAGSPPVPESLQGRTAPDFRITGQDGRPHSLHDYRGTYVILYFFPKADTPG